MPALFKRHHRFLLISSLLLSTFFIYQLVPVTSGSPLISQVQINGAGNKSKQDFIKLFNPDSKPFDLKGHRLIKRSKTSTSDTSIKSFTIETIIPSGAYFTWATSEDGFADSIGADTATSQSLSEDNGIALRQGSADEGLIIDSVAWGEADNDLTEGTIFATNPGPGQILTRKNNLDTNNNSADFYLVEPNSPAGPLTPSDSIITNTPYLNQIFINELVSDPTENSTEWVELYNHSNQSFNLDNWTLEDGSGAKTILSGTINKYFVIESPKGNLNNAGDSILLKDPSGQIIDRMSYGNWLDDQNNAPAADSPHSLALKEDGSSSGADLDAWVITSSPTKNSSNLISSADEISDPNSKTADTSINCPLIINEVLPDPLGADLVGEFIEIYNPTTKPVDLIGWSITINNQLPFVFGLQSLAPLNYLALPRSITKLVLANDGATINLREPQAEKICFKFKYSGASPGASFGFNNDTLTWSKPIQQWSRQPSAGGKNSTLAINQSPSAIINHNLDGQTINFDASDSTDPNADQLLFQWQFGDGATSLDVAGSHRYAQAGTYTVKLIASDRLLSNTASLTIVVGTSDTVPPSQEAKLTQTPIKTPQTTNTITAKAAPQSSTKTTTIKKSTASSSASANSSTLQLTGTVLDKPGTFSSLYFFMLPAGESQAWQIYRQKGQLPTLTPGEQITVNGRRSSIANIKRLLIDEVSDIVTSGLGTLAPANPITIDQAGNHLGELVTVSGEITDRAKDNFYLDDNQADILVRLKPGTGLSADSFILGASHTITGLLVMGSKEIELWPRSLADTDLTSQSSAPALSPSSSLDTDKPTKDNQEFLAHLLIAVGTILVITAIIIFKKSRNKG